MSNATPTNPKEDEQKSAKTPSFKSIDRDIRTLTSEMEQEQTLMPETQNGRVARLVKIYNGIKPLLTVSPRSRSSRAAGARRSRCSTPRWPPSPRARTT